MTNFDFLLSDPSFAAFADVAVSAEKILHIDTAACVLNCRRAVEFAVKWMYSVDKDLEKPDDERLNTLMDNKNFRDIVGEDVWQRIDIIRIIGNDAAHDEKKITCEQAELCLENLFYFLDCVAYCYAEDYEQMEFDKSLLELTTEEALSFVTEKTVNLDDLIAENRALKEELTARREKWQQTYVPKPIDISEYKARNIYAEEIFKDDDFYS